MLLLIMTITLYIRFANLIFLKLKIYVLWQIPALSSPMTPGNQNFDLCLHEVKYLYPTCKMIMSMSFFA